MNSRQRFENLFDLLDPLANQYKWLFQYENDVRVVTLYAFPRNSRRLEFAYFIGMGVPRWELILMEEGQCLRNNCIPGSPNYFSVFINSYDLHARLNLHNALNPNLWMTLLLGEMARFGRLL